MSHCHLQGSAYGFLTKGWTALTSLSLTETDMDDAFPTAALKLPALEDVMIRWFSGCRGGELHLDQLTGSCPQISRLRFQLGTSLAHANEASRQSCRLLNLSRLADLHVWKSWPLRARVDLDLPPSLTQLKFGDYYVYRRCCVPINFFWALQEAVKCVERGARLHKLSCICAVAFLQHTQWGASLDEQHRWLGGQLSGLRELEVWGAEKQLLSAVGAVASAAPSLVRLDIVIMNHRHNESATPRGALTNLQRQSGEHQGGVDILLLPRAAAPAYATDVPAWLHPAPGGGCALVEQAC